MPRTRKSPPADSATSSRAPARARAASKAPLEGRVCELERRLALLEQIVRDLSFEPAQPAQPLPQTTPDPGVLGSDVLEAIGRLDREGRLDGLVPIPWLRRKFPSTDKLHLDRALLELERAFRIDLKIANDPLAVEAAGDGIQHPARGLLYYAVVR